MAPPVDRFSSSPRPRGPLLNASTSGTASSTAKKPSNYSTLKYSPPKKVGYVLSQKSESRTSTKILSMSRTATVISTDEGEESPPIPKKRDVKDIKGRQSPLAQPENFELTSTSSSSESAKANANNVHTYNSTQNETVIASQPKAVTRVVDIPINHLEEERTLLLSSSLLHKKTNLDGLEKFPGNVSDTNHIIVSQANADSYNFRYGSGHRGEKRRDDKGCCDCLFNCFECMFVIL